MYYNAVSCNETITVIGYYGYDVEQIDAVNSVTCITVPQAIPKLYSNMFTIHTAMHNYV